MTSSPMDCAAIRSSLLGGSLPTGPDVEAHVRDCAPCSELLLDQGVLGKELSRSEPPIASSDALWSSIDGAISAESGPRAWLRSRKTSVRVLLATAVGVVIVAVGGRSAGDFTPAAQAIAWLGLFSLGGIACLWLLVAPLGRPIPIGTREALAWVALALPLGYALSSSTLAAQTGEVGFAEQAFACFVYGSVLASPFLGVVWTLDRSDRKRGMLLTGMAAAAGLVANAALALHCPNTAPLHLATGHATIGVVLAGIGALFALARTKSAS